MDDTFEPSQYLCMCALNLITDQCKTLEDQINGQLSDILQSDFNDPSSLRLLIVIATFPKT